MTVWRNARAELPALGVRVLVRGGIEGHHWRYGVAKRVVLVADPTSVQSTRIEWEPCGCGGNDCFMEFEPSDWMPLPKALSHERDYAQATVNACRQWRRLVWVYRSAAGGWCVNLLGRSWHVERIP